MKTGDETMRARTQPDLWAGVVRQVAESNEAALARLYDGTSPMVYGLAMRVVRDPSAAEDITLEVYLQVWRKAASYDPERGEVLPWLATLVRSRAIDYLRSRKARRAEFEDNIQEIAELRDFRPNPELECMTARNSRLVQSAIGELPSEQREVIELAYFSELSHSEISKQTGLPLGTVKTRIRLGMMALQKSLKRFIDKHSGQPVDDVQPVPRRVSNISVSAAGNKQSWASNPACTIARTS
jgi:RNA polymerase sigma-70 factor (ECF subfamily)